MTKKIPIFWLLLFFPMLSSGYDFSNLRNTPMQWVDGTLLLPSRWYLLSDKELNDKGHVFEESHESDSALLYYGILAQRLESRLANKVADTNDIHLYIKIRNEMGLIYMSDFHDIQAFQCFLDAYEWSLVSKKEIYRMSVLTNMGILYMNHDDGEKAYPIFSGLFEEACATGDTWLASRIFVNAINCAIVMEDTTKIRSCIDAFQPSFLLYSGSRFALGQGLSFLAKERGDWLKARNAIQDIWNTIPFLFDSIGGYAAAWLHLAQAYERGGKYDSALVALAMSSNYASQQDNKEWLRDNYRMLADIYWKKGDMASYAKATHTYFVLSDSTMDAMRYASIKDLEYTAYKNRQERKMMDLEHQQSYHEQVIRTQKNVISGVLGFLTLVLILLFMLYRQKRLISQKNVVLYEKNKALMAYADSMFPEPSLEEHLGHEDPGERFRTEKMDERKDDEEENRKKKRQVRILTGKIQEILEEGLCLNPDFSLEKLADMLDSNTSYVSAAINESFGQNFTSLVNTYRIRKACSLMDDPTNRNYTLDYIAAQVGFKNRNTFTQNFKRYTGLLPSQYIKLAIKEKRGK